MGKRRPKLFDFWRAIPVGSRGYGAAVSRAGDQHGGISMLLAQKLASFSKGDADVLRKAMGKKQKSVLDKMKAQFISGATKNGHPAETLEKIWTDWESFAQYAFNKSHSTCYSLVAYQTAYLKANYPAEYMAAVLKH